MKRHIILALAAILTLPVAAQEGKCGVDARYTFDGNTLTIQNVNKKGFQVSIDNYDISRNLAPWRKKKFANRIKRVEIGAGISAIGSANLKPLARILIIITMYIGRMGPLTMALLFTKRQSHARELLRYPEDRVMIG